MHTDVHTESWPYKVPFRVSRGAESALDVVVVTLRDAEGRCGRGEAAGVDYDGETVPVMAAELQAALVDAPDDDAQLAQRLTGLRLAGSRNALDCALWDLRAKRAGQRAWTLAGIDACQPLTTAITLGIDTDEATRRGAQAYRDWPLIKVKVDGGRHVEVLRLVRDICAESALIVDPNQAWDITLLNELAPELAALGVVLIEQPIARGADAALAGYVGEVPLAADESLAKRADLERIRDFYDVVNVKLDKTGGLTEALATARAARALGLQVMVGCMAGTSLAMAPGMVLGQLARFIDLDGPLLHARDRADGIVYERGRMQPPTAQLWG